MIRGGGTLGYSTYGGASETKKYYPKNIIKFLTENPKISGRTEAISSKITPGWQEYLRTVFSDDFSPF